MNNIIIDLDSNDFAPITEHVLTDLIVMTESCWPEGATCATQERDGEIIFWSAEVNEVIKARKNANLTFGLLPLLGLANQIHSDYYEINEQSYLAADWDISVVTKEQLTHKG